MCRLVRLRVCSTLLALVVMATLLWMLPCTARAAVGDLSLQGISGVAVSGSVATGYTVYLRDADTTDIDLKLRNTSGHDLTYVTMTDFPTYQSSATSTSPGETVSPITFPRSYYGRIVPPAAGAEYNEDEQLTSETTGVRYQGFTIGSGDTATFTLRIDGGDGNDLPAGTYPWSIQLGRERNDYKKVTESFNGISYDTWPWVGSEVEEVYSDRIPITVVVYHQPDASIMVGENIGTEYNPVIEPRSQSSGIDFGTIDLASTDESVLKAVRTIYAYNNSKAIATDAHGNTTDITVNFTSESAAVGNPFAFGNIYSGYQLYLYDTTWAPLPPIGLSNQRQYASYSTVLDATKLIAGTYTANFIVTRVPATIAINGTLINASSVYRIPVSVTLTGTNPRLLPRVTDLRSTAGNGSVELRWTPTEQANRYSDYSIYRRVGQETQTDPDKLDWSLYEKIGTKTVGYNDELLFIDADVQNDTTYSYTVMCGEPNRGYAALVSTATPRASIQGKLLAPSAYANGEEGHVSIEWEMNEAYGSSSFDGAGMVDYFNVYRDGTLVDRVYRSAVKDQISYGWHDDGTGSQVYGPVSHDYTWLVEEPVPQLYVDYQWTVSAVSFSGIEGYRDEECPASAYGSKPAITGHEAYFDDNYYVNANPEEFNGVPAIAIRIGSDAGNGPADELLFWRSVGSQTQAYDISKPPYKTVPGTYNDEYGSNVQFADKDVTVGQTYTYTVRARGYDGAQSEPYTFTVVALTPPEDGYHYFMSPQVQWRITNGTTAHLSFTAPYNVTARVLRNGSRMDVTGSDWGDEYLFDIEDDPGRDGSYVYRVEFQENSSGIKTFAEYSFERNTGAVDTSNLIVPPEAPQLAGRTSGSSNVVLSWTPAATGSAPEGYHIYRKDADQQKAGGRYVSVYRWNGNTDVWRLWGNDRYMSIEDASTLSFVDGSSGNYKGDKYLGLIEGLSWEDDALPHTYWITAYNHAGESAPSKPVVFNTHDVDQYGYAIAPAHNVDGLPGAPSIDNAWIEWEDSSSLQYGFDNAIRGKVRVSWSDSVLGDDINSWLVTYAGTYVEDSGLNPPQTDSLEFYEAILDPATKLGQSDQAPAGSVYAESGSKGDLARTLSITVAAVNGNGSTVSSPKALEVRSFPRFYALPNDGGAVLRWTDLFNDKTTKVTSWELWRKAAYGLWELVGTKDASAGYDGVGSEGYSSPVNYYEWRDNNATNGWSYHYKVVARCADGKERSSVEREVQPQRTAAVEAPGAPRNLTAKVTNGTVILNWDAPLTGGAVGTYSPQVNATNIDWGYYTIPSVSGSSTSTTWSPSQPGTYQIAVWAYTSVDGVQMPKTLGSWEIDGYDNMTNSEKLDALYPNHSNVVTVEITQADINQQPTETPDKPQLTATPGDGKVTITWPACNNATRYTISRENNLYPSIPKVEMAVVPGLATYSYVDVDAEPGVRYRYIVTALNSNRGIYSDVYAIASGTTRNEAVAAQVEELIAALPSPSELTSADAAQVTAVAEIFDTLSEQQRMYVRDDLVDKLRLDVVLSEDAQLQESYAELVAPVQKLIDELPDADKVLRSDEAQITHAREAYDALQPVEAKRLVNVGRLVVAELALAALEQDELDASVAAQVVALIDELPSTEALTDADKERIEAARAAFEALTPSQQAFVSNLEVLVAAEGRMAELLGTIADLADATVTVSGGPHTYTGMSIEPDVIVVLGETKLMRGIDYTVAYTNNVDAGEARVSVEGKGAYVGTRGATFAIEPAELATVRVVPLQDQHYTGVQLKPTVSAWHGDVPLIEGRDFTSSYEDNVSGPVATVTLEGKGNFKGQTSVRFNIVGAPGNIPVDTPIEMYRLYNPNSGEHFYTANAVERDYLDSIGWDYEGVGWLAPVKGDPVYRLYNPNAGDHHYTTSVNERNYLDSIGWDYEGVGWQSAGKDGVPLYRLYNPNATGSGAHHYTTNVNERDYLDSIGWDYEGIGWYGIAG